jgi:hypothetical protein
VSAHFEDRLLTALLDEYEQLTTIEPSPPLVAARSRRVTLRLAIVGAGACAIGAAAAVIATTGTGTHRPSGAPRPAGTRSLAAVTRTATIAHGIDIDYVVHGMRQALNANTDVLHELSHAPDSQTGAPTIEETWSRGGTDTTHTITLNQSGQPISAALLTITPHQTTSILIDYASKSYTERTYPFGSDAPGPAPAPATPTGQAATLRAQVASGDVSLVGTTTVNGQQALQLRDTTSQYGVIELWVDPATYLPIQEIDIPTGASADSNQSIRTEYQWLPATQTNVAELTPNGSIPPGFQPATTY